MAPLYFPAMPRSSCALIEPTSFSRCWRGRCYAEAPRTGRCWLIFGDSFPKGSYALEGLLKASAEWAGQHLQRLLDDPPRVLLIALLLAQPRVLAARAAALLLRNQWQETGLKAVTQLR